MKATFTPDEVVQRLQYVHLLTPVEADELKKCIVVRHFKKNEVIYSEGDVPEHMLCVLQGKVKIFRNGVGGRNQIVRVLKPQESLGYRAYFANQNYVTTAAAFENSIICLIPMESINCWIHENIDLALYFVHQLSADLGVSDQRLVSLTQKHIRGRLAESLLFLLDSYGTEQDNPSTLDIAPSREDLANLSNMTTSNAIRTLSAFASEGLIALDGRKITLLNIDMLKKISKMGG